MYQADKFLMRRALMRKLVIFLMLSMFAVVATGCENAQGTCPHGVCKPAYYEDNEAPPEK
jgi:hypothetical protein